MRNNQFRFAVTTLAGSSLKNIASLHTDFEVDPGYRIKYLFSAVVAAMLEIVNPLERLIWGKRIRNYHPEAPPVFIVGFWRSGTTLLHNLLCQDPQAAYTTTFQTVFPNLVLTQSWWLKPITNLFLPARRPYDNVSMDMDFPQEEDFGLMNMQPSSVYKFFIFPKDFDRILEEELSTTRMSVPRLLKWKEAYRTMVAKAVFNTKGIRYIGKNPCHLMRIPLLMEMFPGAKFIFIHRHPYNVIESLYRFMLTIFPGVQLQDVPDDFSQEKVTGIYTRMMDTWFRSRESIPPNDLIELQYDKFLQDIPGHLEAIFTQFGMGDFGRISERILRFIATNPYPEHNSITPSPETITLINQHAADIMKRLGY